MTTSTRSAVLALFVLVLALSALPALASESGDGAATEESTTTTEVATFEYQPAVTLPPVAPAEVDHPWTTKFLVPTGLALAAIAVFVTVIQYFLRVVRSRYKVVE